jgi:hypothetical protein
MDIKNETSGIHNIFESISDRVILDRSQICSKTFKIKDLPNHNKYSTNANTHENSRYLFTELDKIECDCLYWFTLENSKETIALNNLLNEFREINIKGSENYRSVPATNKNNDSNVLYVGVRRGGITKKWNLTNITGRINQHLGYYHNGNTQGLQLIHFAKDYDFDITINVVKIESSNSIYLNIIEKIVAKKLKPLCGRH